MKVFLVTLNLEGGGGGAASRLNQGLQSIGIDTQVLTAKKISDHAATTSKTKLDHLPERLRRKLENLPAKLYFGRERSRVFCGNWLPTDAMISQVKQVSPDIINLHCIYAGFVQIEAIPKLNKPIVWTLHDMWPFTGGCDYSQGCERYTDSCGACPILGSSQKRDLSHWVWQRKAKAWKELNLTLVSPTSWLAKCASSSSLFQNLRIEVIPNGIDTRIFKPLNRQAARKLLDLPQNQKIILFGAWSNEPRKGAHLLQQALQRLSQSECQDQIEIVAFGLSEPSKQSEIGFKIRYLGKIQDQNQLAAVYAAADVFVAPSIQDNLPTTVLEALACGIPCVAFNVGGMPDMIEHQKNGYLAKPFDTSDLAGGIAWVLEDEQRYQSISRRAWEKVQEEFTMDLQARRYTALFDQVLSSDSNRSLVAAH